MADNDGDESISVLKLQISPPQKNRKIRPKRRRSSALVPPSNPLVEQKKKRDSPAAVSMDGSQTKKKFTTLRDFALFALNASNESPRFFEITNRGSIEKVVAILIPGLPIESFHIESNGPPLVEKMDNIPKELSFLKDQFSQLLVTTAPGDKHSIFPPITAFTSRRLTKNEKKKLCDRLRSEKVTIPKLKMTLQQFNENLYPIHPDTEGVTPETNEPLKDGWIDTKPFEHDGSHTFALDCEMCETAKGKVLTRVSMIDFNDTVIFDELVKPDDDITDYLTLYSGITEEKLRNVTTSLRDIQQLFLRHVSSTDYLIGHSLENDLNVLKIRHPNIVDTSLIFEHHKGPPFKSSLKYITKSFLNRTIQEGSHDSVEDSKCCLDLVKLKLVEGGLFGKVIGNVPISEDMKKVNKRASIIDYARVHPNQDTYIQCSNDDDVVDKTISSIDNAHLVVANLREIEKIEDKSEADLSGPFEKLNDRLNKIYESIPNNTAVIISSGSGDLSHYNKLKQQKELFGKQYMANGTEAETSWTLDDEERLAESLEKAKLGVSFVKIKTKQTSQLEKVPTDEKKE